MLAQCHSEITFTARNKHQSSRERYLFEEEDLYIFQSAIIHAYGFKLDGKEDEIHPHWFLPFYKQLA